MAYNRANIVTEVRDDLYEATADILTDLQLQRAIKREIRSLPRKGIYLEELWTTSTVQDQFDYTFPSGTLKIEQVEINIGSSSVPSWEELKGWRMYAGALYLGERPSQAWTMRVHIRKAFSDLTDDTTSSDVPDEKMEVVIQGVLCRAYKMILGYLKDAKNWDAIAKPDGISLRQILEVYQEAKKDYRDMLNNYRSFPVTRDIDLVG